MTVRRPILAAAAFQAALLIAAPKPEFKAGVAVIDITPTGSIWMSGYAARTKPSEGVDMPLHAKALAIEDSKGHRVVIVTTDLIGLPREITDPVSARVGQVHNLRRAQILFNSSHTHAGPVVWPNLKPMFALDAMQQKAVEDYARRLREDLFAAVDAALGKLEPVTLHYGEGTAGFAINRREFRKTGVGFGANPQGPMDHKVPVVDIRSIGGKHLALLFGYTCHNTTLGADAAKLSGDYAGAAQREIESRFPGTTALFLLLCGADQNPNPRGKTEHVEEYGKQLAGAVAQALEGKIEAIHAPLRTAFQLVDVAFAPHSREQFEEETKNKDVFRVRRAQLMLAKYDARLPVNKIAYPVQAIRFNKDLTVLALGGEVVVDYQLRAKRHYPAERLIVAGYSNDVMCYIPSLRVLREGGYEADTSMIYYGQPGKFSEDVEETIFTTIRRVMKQVGAK
jgi:neutral ceramidase